MYMTYMFKYDLINWIRTASKRASQIAIVFETPYTHNTITKFIQIHTKTLSRTHSII